MSRLDSITSFFTNFFSSNLKENEGLCVMPWLSLTVRNGGEVLPCFQFDHLANEKPYLKNFDSPFLDGREQLSLMRKRMLSGEKIKGCESCIKSSNFKDMMNQEFEAEFLEIQKTKRENALPLKRLMLGLGNKCNLKCPSCGPQASLLWAETYRGKGEVLDWFSNFNINQLKREEVVDLEEITISGGEPLLVESHFIFLEKLIDLGLAPKITLQYFTNGTVPKSERMVTIFDQFKKVIINFSFDHMEGRSDYLRFPSRWSDLYANMMTYQNHETWIMITVSILNLYYIEEFVDWCEKQEVISGVNFNIVEDPDYLSPYYLSSSYQKVIKEREENTPKESISNLYKKILENQVSFDPDDLHARRTMFLKIVNLKTKMKASDIFKEVTPLLI